MRHTPLLPLLLSVAVLAVSAVGGTVAFYGAPWVPASPASRYELPQTEAGIPVHEGSSPVYLVDAAGSARLVGRVVPAGVGAVEVRAFPDMADVDIERYRAIYIETSVKTIWSLVPMDAREAIAAQLRDLLRNSRIGFERIVRNARFREVYRPDLEQAAMRIARTAWRDPELKAAGDAVLDYLRQARTEDLRDSVLAVLMGHISSALLEIAAPSWQKVSDLVRLRGLDTSPINRAVLQTLEDEAVRDALAREAVRALGEPSVERFVRSLTFAIAETAAQDRALHETLQRIVDDPAFAGELRDLEEASAHAFTEIFYLVVGRSGERKPDPLAVRIIRFVLINRRSHFVLLVPEEALRPGSLPGLARYTPLRRQGATG